MNIKNHSWVKGFTVVLLVGLLTTLTGCGVPGGQKTYRVGISQCVTHPILDEVRAGIFEGLAEEGFIEGENIEYDLQVSEMDESLAKTIADKFVSQNVDLIIAICTPNTLAAMQATDKIPIVFSYVTDAKQAGIVENREQPGGNVTGTESVQPAAKWAEITQELLPDAKTIGVVLDPGDEGSSITIVPFTQRAEELGMKIIVAPANGSAEVYAAAQSLVRRADAIFQAGDATAEAAFDSLVKVADENQIPLLGSEARDAEVGAVVALAQHPRDHGKVTGGYVARVLKGENPGTIPVWGESIPRIYVNLAAAERQGVTVPQSLLDRASEVYK